MIITVTTLVGTILYCAGLTCDRTFAWTVALLGAAAVPVVLIG